MGNLWHSCVKVCEAIKLQFQVVSGPEDWCISWGFRSHMGKRSFWGFSSLLVWIAYLSALVIEKRILFVHKKSIRFPFGQYINVIIVDGPC